MAGHRQEGPAPAFLGRGVALLGQAALLGRGPVVFTAARGIMALVCRRHRLRITIVARGEVLASARAQVDSGGRAGIMAAVAADVAASLPSWLCW